VVRRCVLSRNLINQEVLAPLGSQRHKQKYVGNLDKDPKHLPCPDLNGLTTDVAAKCGNNFGNMRSEIATHYVTIHNTPIHDIISTAPQLSISQKAQGTLPEDGNVKPKHVGATIHI
jgi:hypothetical protein